MKENLFFRATRSIIQKVESYSVSSMLIMLPLLSMPLFFNAFALKAYIPQQDQQAIIYVGENTVVFGTSNISNASLVKIKKTTISKKVVQPAKSAKSISEQVAVHKKFIERRVRKIQKEITARTTFYYFSEEDQNSISWNSSKIHFGGLAISVTSFKITGRAELWSYILHFFAAGCEKQKFNNSYAFNCSRKFRSFSLRAPPIFPFNIHTNCNPYFS